MKTISFRCRVMLPLVNKALKKNNKQVPQWVRELDIDMVVVASTQSPEAPKRSPSASSDPASCYKFGCIDSNMQAFRVPIDRPSAKKELSFPLELPAFSEGF